MPCDSSFLANIGMFEHLNEDDRIALANVVDELKVPEGHTLFQAGDPGDSLFIVRVGQIELCWGCTGCYTGACITHDWCVSQNGYRACNYLLDDAIASMYFQR